MNEVAHPHSCAAIDALSLRDASRRAVKRENPVWAFGHYTDVGQPS